MDFKGHGNSFHGESGRGNKLAQLRQSIRLLLSMCSSGDDAVIQDLHEQGGIPILLGQYNYYILTIPAYPCISLHIPAYPCISLHIPAYPCISLHIPAYPCISFLLLHNDIILGLIKYFMKLPELDVDNPILLEMQGDVLLILSCICELDIHRKVGIVTIYCKQKISCLKCKNNINLNFQELFGGCDGVNLVVRYLKRDIGKFGSGLGHNRLLLAVTDCVWCAVVGNLMVEDIFLENEGAFVLLDLLKVSNSHLKSYLILYNILYRPVLVICRI